MIFFQGTVVAVKKIDGSKFNINRKLLIDLKTVSYTNCNYNLAKIVPYPVKVCQSPTICKLLAFP